MCVSPDFQVLVTIFQVLVTIFKVLVTRLPGVLTNSEVYFTTVPWDTNFKSCHG